MTDEMTATERLRQLLDERGVEWRADETSTDYVTEWDAEPAHAVFFESKTTNPDMLEVRYYWPSPEQAIEATLGRGTCKWEPADFITEGEWWNTSCGESFTWEPDGTPRYCPNCGRKVEQ